MSTQLAAKLHPYLVYFVFVQLVLLCMAVLVGCYLILKRFSSKEEPASLGGTADGKSIAAEINQEILRLQNLRNRLDPTSTNIVSVATVEPAVSAVAATQATPAVLDAQAKAVLEAELKAQLKPAIEAEVRAHLEGQLRTAAEAEAKSRFDLKSEELVNKMAALEVELAKAKESGVSAAPQEGPPNAEAIEKLSAAKSQNSELEGKIAHLEKVLSEYRIFEEDFALVKKYKAENEKYKKMLEDKGLVAAPAAAAAEAEAAPMSEGAPATPVSPEDITKLFSEFNYNELSAPATSEPTTPAAPAPTPTPVAAAALAPTQPSAPPPGFDQEKVKAEPVVATAASQEEDVEALAESAASDDQIMQEFEKLLGDKAS